ncbi:hypothetical protein SAMN04488035_1713 [Flavimobilis marinus]|uniref:IPT/TIG domain-containing protein n=1 Tax=Flavimobilis marinus TaxID=285351 RepID=A0A1I2G504_9MICO|nr:hypothetical protein [Flavimobilis marinus]SFF12258.1 hypothetical protein SAMN04488035_1713 [Flavimobilis marinus]
MTTTSRRVWAGAAAVVTMAGLAGCAPDADPATSANQGPASSAACAQPQLAVYPAAVAAGEKVYVSGTWFTADCDDTVEIVNGREVAEPVVPLTGIDVVLRQAGEEVARTTLDADAKGRFSTSLVLPAGATTGTVEVTAGHAEPSSIDVVAG